MKFLNLIIFATIFISCNNNSSKCSNDGIGPNGEIYKTVGCTVNSLEEGLWKVYDSNQKLSETGKYENGIRIGIWQYGATNPKQTINWLKYENDKIGIKTNIPTGLEIIEDTSNFIKFSNKDSSNLFYLAFIIHSLAEEYIKPSEYYKVGESEIQEQGLKYQENRTRLDLRNDTLYFNSYHIEDGKKGLSVLNIYKKVNDHLLEVVCRYNDPSELEAKRVFFSVISNLFFKKNRFMNLADKINIVALK